MWHVELGRDLVATDMEQRERNNAITLHCTALELSCAAGHGYYGCCLAPGYGCLLLSLSLLLSVSLLLAN